jgi:hypothetical protein
MKMWIFWGFLVVLVLASAAEASRVVSVIVSSAETINSGDYIRLSAVFDWKGTRERRVLIERTRVVVAAPSPVKDRIVLTLPCVTTKEAMNLQSGNQLGPITAEVVERGVARNTDEMGVPRASLADGWC